MWGKEMNSVTKQKDLSSLFVNAGDLKIMPPASKITDLKLNQKNHLFVVALRKGDARFFTSRAGFPCRVCNVEVTDDSGIIDLVLFNKQIGIVEEGDKIEIINCDLDEFNGEKNIKVGKFGRLINHGKLVKNTQMKFKEVKENE